MDEDKSKAMRAFRIARDEDFIDLGGFTIEIWILIKKEGSVYLIGVVFMQDKSLWKVLELKNFVFRVPLLLRRHTVETELICAGCGKRIPMKSKQ